jgi:hypothetical protein
MDWHDQHFTILAYLFFGIGALVLLAALLASTILSSIAPYLAMPRRLAFSVPSAGCSG